MHTTETCSSGAIASDVIADLKAAAQRAASGIRDPEAMKQACAHMDAVREKNRLKFGVQDIGVQIIREMRDGQ
jgi:hypothetical protein